MKETVFRDTATCGCIASDTIITRVRVICLHESMLALTYTKRKVEVNTDLLDQQYIFRVRIYALDKILVISCVLNILITEINSEITLLPRIS
jgi:hypothetical protein